MAKKVEKNDGSTACELIFKEWLDSFSEESVAKLKEKSENLTGTIAEMKEKTEILKKAREEFMDNYKELPNLAKGIQDVAKGRMKFLQKYGTCGIEQFPSLGDITAQMAFCIDSLNEYGKKAYEKYFQKLSAFTEVVGCMEHLKKFYSNMADIIDTIRNVYFKELPDRRKPIVRELYRKFSDFNISESEGPVWLYYFSPDTANPYIDKPMDTKEYNAILNVLSRCRVTAKAIKNAR